MFNNNKLRNRRIDMGLTLEEVGSVVGISASAVLKHEKGSIKNIYLSTVEGFARALRCSPAYLMDWTDNPSDTKTQSVHEKKLVEAYRDNPKMQEAVDRLLNIDEHLLNDINTEISNEICNTIKYSDRIKK